MGRPENLIEQPPPHSVSVLACPRSGSDPTEAVGVGGIVRAWRTLPTLECGSGGEVRVVSVALA